MNQPAEEALILWSTLVVVFGVSFGIGTSGGVRSGASAAHIALPMTPVHVYRGPSNNDAVTPHLESLVYFGPTRARDDSANPVEAQERDSLD